MVIHWRFVVAMFWHGRSGVTMGTTAALAGLSQAQFMHALKQAGQETVLYDPEDLAQEFAFLAERRSSGPADA